MTDTILQNPYAAILRAIWSIIVAIAQSTANTLNIRWLTSFSQVNQHENNTIPDGGAANPTGLLHPDCRNGGAGMKHVIMYSSGIGSWATAKQVIAKHGVENIILLFADTQIEDEDNYRFLEESANSLGCQLVKVADGRDPWEIFEDKRWLGNSRIAQCSHLLKQQPCLQWLKQFDPEHKATLYVGIDWTELHRLKAIQKHWQPWKVEAPLTEPPYLDKLQVLEKAKEEGLEPPRLYKYHFAHANCGGFCVRAGQAHFANLLKHFPERYRHHEAKEQELRQFLGKEVAILREQHNREKQPLTLTKLRERIESRSYQLDLFDWGGCGCFTADVEVSDE